MNKGISLDYTERIRLDRSNLIDIFNSGGDLLDYFSGRLNELYDSLLDIPSVEISQSLNLYKKIRHYEGCIANMEKEQKNLDSKIEELGEDILDFELFSDFKL